MSEIDAAVAAYFAGLFDGEGSVTVRLDERKDRRGIAYFTCQLVVVNTHHGVLDLLQSLYGGAIYTQKRDKAHHQPTWRWVVTAKKAERFAHDILPFTIIKTAQLDLFLEARALMRPPANKRRTKKITDPELEARREMVERVRAGKRPAS